MSYASSPWVLLIFNCAVQKAHLSALVRLRENRARNVPAWLPVERGRLTRNGLFGRSEACRKAAFRLLATVSPDGHVHAWGRLVR